MPQNPKAADAIVPLVPRDAVVQKSRSHKKQIRVGNFGSFIDFQKIQTYNLTYKKEHQFVRITSWGKMFQKKKGWEIIWIKTKYQEY